MNLSFDYKYTLPIILNETKTKKVMIFGDSFANLVTIAPQRRTFSWMWHLGNLLDVSIETYGVPGGAESTCLYCYQQAYNESRDFTIIFHTHPNRSDNYFNLRDITAHDYKRWDTALKKHKCLHIYWSNTKNYSFKNGKKLKCEYWTKICTEAEDKDIDGFYKSLAAINHLTLEDSEIFAKDVYNKIKGEF
tara:strand:+ start:1020 stop:1592 length:573 start_codon:yes stop_codon:yes gene_type:complete